MRKYKVKPSRMFSVDITPSGLFFQMNGESILQPTHGTQTKTGLRLALSELVDSIQRDLNKLKIMEDRGQ